MPKTRQQKEKVLQDLVRKFSEAKGVAFANFTGLNVKDVNDLRKKCREAGVEYVVAKKTLVKKALKEIGLEEKDFVGEIATAMSAEDEVAPAKTLNDFAKAHEQVKLVAGILEHRILETAEVKALAKLPSKLELRAKFVGTIQAPISGFVNVLAGNLRGLVQVLNAIKDTKGA